MSKESDSTSKSSEQNEMFRALTRAQREARLWKNKYQAAASGKKPDESATNQEIEATNQPIVSEKPAESTKGHTWKAWQAACTDCGEKNPDYKPETKCDNCGGTLGTVEVAKKLDFCPHCAQKAKFVPLTAEAREKIRAMVKA